VAAGRRILLGVAQEHDMMQHLGSIDDNLEAPNKFVAIDWRIDREALIEVEHVFSHREVIGAHVEEFQAFGRFIGSKEDGTVDLQARTEFGLDFTAARPVDDRLNVIVGQIGDARRRHRAERDSSRAAVDQPLLAHHLHERVVLHQRVRCAVVGRLAMTRSAVLLHERAYLAIPNLARRHAVKITTIVRGGVRRAVRGRIGQGIFTAIVCGRRIIATTQSHDGRRAQDRQYESLHDASEHYW
jgi:hypothetical protein